MKLKRVLSLGLAAVTACSMLAVTGCGNQSADEDDSDGDLPVGCG